MHSIEYVYCVVPASFDIADAPAGIDDAPIRLIPCDDVAAVASTLERDIYHPGHIEQAIANVEWLTPRAVAHDRIVTWVSDRIATVPLPMWTLFSDDQNVLAALGGLKDRLRSGLDTVTGAREYTVRLFVDGPALTAAAASLSPQLAALQQRVAAASPGQAYLMRRKLDAERKTEVRAITRQVGDETYYALTAIAEQSVRDPLPQGEREGSAILNASFLVHDDRYDQFRAILTELIAKYQSSGFRFDFTGPWPAYHFVRVS